MHSLEATLFGRKLLPVLALVTLVLFTACSGEQAQSAENLTDRIDQLLTEKRFDEAFDLLDDAAEAPMVNGAAYEADNTASATDAAQTESTGYGSHTQQATLHSLLINTHLAYASYLTHEADHLAMGQRMGDALRHFRRVVELDPENSIALTHVELIEGIYAQMGRDVPEGVAR